jgi:hypothetical protein
MLPPSMRSQKMVFIMAWKVAGELVSLKNIMVGSKSPSFVMNATFHLSFFLMRTSLYPHSMSNPVNRVAPLRQSMSWGIRGRG